MAREQARPEGWLKGRLEKVGWSMREFAFQVGEQERQVRRWDSGQYEFPALLEQWLERFEGWLAENPPPKKAEHAVRGKGWAEPGVAEPPPAAAAPRTAAAPAAAAPAAPDVPPMTTDEGRACLDELGWSQRSFADLLQWPDIREARRWFQDHDRYPMPPEVANWLRAAVNAKRMAHKAVPPGTPEPSIAAVVGAAIAAAVGDPTKVRDAALAARRLRPRPQRSEGARHAEPASGVEEILPPDYQGGGPARRGPVLDLTRRRG